MTVKNVTQNEEICTSDIEYLLMRHTAKLTFLADAFSQPISVNSDFELSRCGQDGLSFILYELRDEANKLDRFNLQLTEEEHRLQSYKNY